MNLPTKDEIINLRKAAGLTQTQAAALVYRTLRAWQQYEQGSRPIDLCVWELFNIKTATMLEQARRAAITEEAL